MSETDLTVELGRQLALLVEDLRGRADTSDEVAEVVEREWHRAREAKRTALDFGSWREGLLDEVGVAWVLATTFVRFCEDNHLLSEPVLAGPGRRGARAEEAQRLWFRGSAAGERAYVEHVVAEAAKLPGLRDVFDAHNPFWLFGPSEDAVRNLLGFWREVDPDTGTLRRDLTDPALDTRFLGDLYQDLSVYAKKQYALLQTPEFVERFILERTLEPALDEFGLAGFRMIDPACGSGHFLLGAFDTLLERWRQRAPQVGDRALAERALAALHGVDINAAAAAIARFRLLVAALKACAVDGQVPPLAEAPNFTLNVAVGDSLLHGPAPGQQVMTTVAAHASTASRHVYATEDRETITRFLSQRYHAVVANPPYITPKDPAANAAYRAMYPEVCHRQYSLAVPFMQRLFDLAERGRDREPAGFVGQITANSFMKREFGTKLIEGFLKDRVDLTHVIDTSGAYIPGHGTPTVILLGRNRGPMGDTVRAVLGIRGEPSRPADPARGEVWTSIVDLVDHPGGENDYVTVTDLERTRLAKHPWSLQGGGAVELKQLLEGRAKGRLTWMVSDVGFGAVTREDDVFRIGNDVCRRLGFTASELARPLVAGEELRDWGYEATTQAIWPYDVDSLRHRDSADVRRQLWAWRTQLSQRVAYGKTQMERGLAWDEYSMFFADRFKTPLAIGFPFVATHNHFVLDRGGKVFNRTAPVIKLPEGTSEEDHLALLGSLNSAVGCFWMKQVSHNKGSTVDQRGARQTTVPFEDFYEFDGTKLKQFPLPEGSALLWARRLDALAQELAENLPGAVVARGTPTRDDLDKARSRVDEIRAEMVAVQEELDWRCLHLYGVTDEDLSLDPADAPPLDRGQRAFEIVLAQRMAAGEVSTTWFERHGATPLTDIPQSWPAPYRQLVQRRIELIRSDRFVGLVERPEYKRRWNWASWDALEAEAMRSWLLDRLEQPDCWPHPRPQSARELSDRLRTDPAFVGVATLAEGIEVDLTDLVARLVRDESVPYLAALRHTAAGLRKRRQWEQVWDLQRREDASETLAAPIPMPPKYTKTDFTGEAWRHRGKLDVSKERFVSYPGAEHPNDPTPLAGWAGWDHLDQARALATLYQQRRTRDGWTAEQLTPLLAGLDELVPWLRQWHNGIDPETGERLGDFFAGFVTSEAQDLGIAADDLAGWRPPSGRRARAGRRHTGRSPSQQQDLLTHDEADRQR